jgi:hypothetical protein
MLRLFWLLLIVALVGAVLTGVSWAFAYKSVGTLLGSPPPIMGTQQTTIEWHGLARLATDPPEWHFAFAPTVIPGAEEVSIYVGPTGEIVRTEPEDLEELLIAFRRTTY